MIPKGFVYSGPYPTYILPSTKVESRIPYTYFCSFDVCIDTQSNKYYNEDLKDWCNGSKLRDGLDFRGAAGQNFTTGEIVR